MAKKQVAFVWQGCLDGDIWYPAEQYPLDNLPEGIKAAIEQGWIIGYFTKSQAGCSVIKN